MYRVKSEGEGDCEMMLQDQMDSPVADDVSSGGGSPHPHRGAAGPPLVKGPWTCAEDAILMDYVQKHGEGNWNAVQKNTGLFRSGKSCRLRWANHLRPNLKKGGFTPEEERLIIQLHAKMGNKWARMAAHLPGRTDNEIRNYWNTRIKRCQRASLPIYPASLCNQSSNEDQQVASLPIYPASVCNQSSNEDQQVSLSIVSSSSGTIVSTAYTSSVSRSSTSSMEAAMHFISMGIHEDVNGNNLEVCKDAEDEEAEVEHIRSLVQEFFSAPSEIRVGDISVVERWLNELGVGWVLSLDGGASAAAGEEEFDCDARSWIRALRLITGTFCFMPLFPDRDSLGMPSICQREGEHVGERCVPDQYHLVLFILKTMPKILNFVDVLISRDNKLITLLRVHDALSEASSSILLEFHSPTTAVEVRRIENEMAILLSAYKNKLCEAIWRTMEKIRTELMTELKEDGDDPSSPQGSSDVHKFTGSVMSYIMFLLSNYLSVDAAICDKYVPPVENELPLIGMMIEMVSCLQEKLASISESIPDQGLRFLFLLNNSRFIKVQLDHHTYSLYRQVTSMIPDVDHKIEAYMERYLQVSWAPLLSCLFNPTPHCLGINYSPLSKFESEFQKIYSTQKQWKVPDPVLRRMLRSVITDKIIPSYTEYIEDNKVTNPKFSPRELNAMLQELFEG